MFMEQVLIFTQYYLYCANKNIVSTWGLDLLVAILVKCLFRMFDLIELGHGNYV